jgi:hypothetical protein
VNFRGERNELQGEREMKQVDTVRERVRGRRGPSHIRNRLSLRQRRVGAAVAADPTVDRARANGAAGIQNAADGRLAPSNGTAVGTKTTRSRAIVIDPDESGRGFAADVLMLFEPGFEVVTTATIDEAAEWMQTFVPDLLVVSDALDQHETSEFVTAVLDAPRSHRCKVVSVQHAGNEQSAVAHWRHATLDEGTSLSAWLETVRRVLAG